MSSIWFAFFVEYELYIFSGSYTLFLYKLVPFCMSINFFFLGGGGGVQWVGSGAKKPQDNHEMDGNSAH
jgi:hypothetical protein